MEREVRRWDTRRRVAGWLNAAVGLAALGGIGIVLARRSDYSLPAFSQIWPFWLMLLHLVGIGLALGRRWPRVILWPISVIDLLAFPFGTVLGGFNLWVLYHTRGLPSTPPQPSRGVRGPPAVPSPFAEVFQNGGYLSLLNLHPDPLDVIARIESVVHSHPDYRRYVASMLAEENWRPHLVACIAVLVSPDKTSFGTALWGALDSGSWVAPQLAVTLRHCDPSFVAEAKRRIAAGCPVTVPHIKVGLLRHVTTGPASPIERSSKNMAALLRLLGTLPAEQEWAQETEKTIEVQEVLRSDRDRSGDIALQWDTKLTELLALRGRPLAQVPPSGDGHPMHAMPLTAVGDLGGRYTLEKMEAVQFPWGQSFLARTTDGQRVASHVITGGAEDDRCLRTALRRLLDLRHPAILALLDVGVIEGMGVFVVTEGFPDTDVLDFAERCSAERDWAPRCLRAVATACDGLAYVHAAGLVHGELDHLRILVRAGGEAGPDEVKVALAGVGPAVRAALPKDSGGLVLGSPFYLSPGVIRGEPPALPDDLWSLGVVLFTCLARGTFPFEGESTIDVVNGILSAPAPALPACGLPPQAHAAVQALLARLLAKDPRARPVNATVVAEELRRIADESSPT